MLSKIIAISLIQIFVFTTYSDNEPEILNVKPVSNNSKIRREVKCVCRDKKGNIVEIGGDWGRKSRVEVVQDIKQGLAEYYVRGQYGHIEIIITNNDFLKTNPDNLKCNNLDNLPSCGGAHCATQPPCVDKK